MASDPESENSEPTWETYYQWLEGRKPRTLFIEALDKFGQADDIHTPRHAIDLGFGDGIETLALLDAGWHVFAIDNEPAALERLRSKSKPQHETHLTLDTASFEEFDPPETDFLFAGLSLPFCRPEAFDRVWGKLAGAIRPGGGVSPVNYSASGTNGRRTHG